MVSQAAPHPSWSLPHVQGQEHARYQLGQLDHLTSPLLKTGSPIYDLDLRATAPASDRFRCLQNGAAEAGSASSQHSLLAEALPLPLTQR